MKKRVVTMKKGVIVSDEKKGGYNNENQYIWIFDETRGKEYQKK